LFGSKTGLRGTKIFGKRPVLAILDDLVDDEDAKSKVSMSLIKDAVYKGVNHTLDPTRRKVIFNGTPFNKDNILVEAVESDAWAVNVYPVCEKFLCAKEELISPTKRRRYTRKSSAALPTPTRAALSCCDWMRSQRRARLLTVVISSSRRAAAATRPLAGIGTVRLWPSRATAKAARAARPAAPVRTARGQRAARMGASSCKTASATTARAALSQAWAAWTMRAKPSASKWSATTPGPTTREAGPLAAPRRSNSSTRWTTRARATNWRAGRLQKGRVLPDLVQRRAQERALCLGLPPKEDKPDAEKPVARAGGRTP